LPTLRQYAEKNSLVKESFVSTADDNYTLARWCFHQNVNVDFYWLAVHSLEKYFKAVLLINGKASKPFGHDIEELYAAVQPLAPELLITQIEKTCEYAGGNVAQ
jgi:HEPN domain-containing protein